MGKKLIIREILGSLSNKKFITSVDIIKIGICKNSTLVRWRQKKKGPPCIKISSKYIYPVSGFFDWLVDCYLVE